MQRINSLEIYYNVVSYDDDDYCGVEYSFYSIDYKIFKQIFLENVFYLENYIIIKNNYKILYIDDDDINQLEPYNKYILLTKNIAIFHRMCYIPYIVSKDKDLNLKRINDALMINTITGDPIT